MTFIVPTLFGVEGLVADELRRLGKNDITAVDGRVMFTGDVADVADANIRLHCGERVLIKLGDAPVESFGELYEFVKSLPWNDYLPSDAKFPVTGHCLRSRIVSERDAQRIIKKAIVDRLNGEVAVNTRLPESGAEYPIRFAIFNGVATLSIDSTGDALYKRGYRTSTNVTAPLRETLAASIVKISRYKGRGSFVDPFCGSGTIAIEAALSAQNRAPGLNRTFAAEQFGFIPPSVWSDARERAIAGEFRNEYDIIASDIDATAIAEARENAARAGVADIIRFEQADALTRQYPRGAIVAANPPYGERMLTPTATASLYRSLGRVLREAHTKLYLLTPNLDFELLYGHRARARRKLYNGMMQCMLYMYF